MKGVPQIKKEDEFTPAPVVPEARPIYDKIEVVRGVPPEDSPPGSPETPVKVGDGENSMEEDDPPHLDEGDTPILQMEDVQMDDSDDGSRMQLD